MKKGAVCGGARETDSKRKREISKARIEAKKKSVDDGRGCG